MPLSTLYMWDVFPLFLTCLPFFLLISNLCISSFSCYSLMLVSFSPIFSSLPSLHLALIPVTALLCNKFLLMFLTFSYTRSPEDRKNTLLISVSPANRLVKFQAYNIGLKLHTDEMKVFCENS